MKKTIGALAATAVLAFGLAVPAMAEGVNGTAATGMGTRSDAGLNATPDNTGYRGVSASSMQRTNGYGYGANGTARSGAGAAGMDGFRANNATRANAATNDDGMDWGWLGLAGLFGLAGMRGREKTTK